MNELYHYGVKGMRWGIKKADYNAMSRDQRKAHKKQFEDDVRDVKKNKGMLFDYEMDSQTGKMQFKQFRNSKGAPVSKEYADAVLAKVGRDKTVRTLATAATVVAGAALAKRMLSNWAWGVKRKYGL